MRFHYYLYMLKQYLNTIPVQSRNVPIYPADSHSINDLHTVQLEDIW